MEYPHLRLRHAFRKGRTTEGLLFIKDVENGLDCNCVCPRCGGTLVAKNNPKNKREAHFAHYKEDGSCNNTGARMSALHRLAQEIIQEECKIMLPAFKKKFVQQEAQRTTFDEVTLEEICKDEISRRRPDCIGKVHSNGIDIWIEIYCTNPINEERRSDIIRMKQYCIEINFSDLLGTDYTKESVRKRLLDSHDDREWICHPLWEKEEAEKEAEERLRIEAERKELEEKQKAIETALKNGTLKLVQVTQKETPVPQFTGVPVSKETWHISETPYNRAVPDTPKTKDWLMWIKYIYAEKDGREQFYRALAKEYTKVNFNNSHPFVVNDAETKINELLVAITINHIEKVNKVYLEFLIVLRVIELLNKSGAYELGKIFVENETLRNAVLKIIGQLQSVTKSCQEQDIKTLLVFQEAENKEAIMQILTKCNIVKLKTL
ncbi:MAG: hypothetical protein J6M55_01250 [Paludibacteraceae bacterium]|nr:hypothetical protein [Paludibacteraceae bacterium]